MPRELLTAARGDDAGPGDSGKFTYCHGAAATGVLSDSACMGTKVLPPLRCCRCLCGLSLHHGRHMFTQFFDHYLARTLTFSLIVSQSYLISNALDLHINCS